MIRIAALTLALLAASSAQAQQQPPAPATTGQTAETPPADGAPIVVEGEKQKRVCEMQSGTGSIIPRRVCRTPQQIAEAEAEARTIRDQLSRDRQTARHTQESRPL